MAACPICGNTKGMSVFDRVKLADGYVCGDCWLKTGLNQMEAKRFTKNNVLEIINGRAINQLSVEQFVATKTIGIFAFDDINNQFLITLKPYPLLKKKHLFSYNNIVSFDILEDNESVASGGIGSAIVGGLLFGPMGAIVGGTVASKTSKSFCTSMEIKITLRNTYLQTLYIPLIEGSVDRQSTKYRNSFHLAQDIISALQIAVDKVNLGKKERIENSAVDEIFKLKSLLDCGAITIEEFQMLKAQLVKTTSSSNGCVPINNSDQHVNNDFTQQVRFGNGQTWAQHVTEKYGDAWLLDNNDVVNMNAAIPEDNILFCTRCGAIVEGNHRFCASCGHSIFDISHNA